MKKSNEACYFLSLALENVACFGRRQTLKLTDKQGNPARWTVIIGDNAYGKTTLLRSLVGITPYSLNDPKSMVFMVKGLDWNYWRNKKRTRVDAKFAVGYKFTSPVEKEIRMPTRSYDGLKERFSTASPLKINCICHAYGAARRMGKAGLSSERKEFMAHSLFDDDAPLTNAEDWLLQADYIYAKDKKYLDYKRQVEEIILNLLPDVKRIEYKIDKRESKVLFETSFGWVGIEDLSLGYRTMLAWAVDFAARLFDRYPESKNPLAEPAILLVDEIDLHLHPQWQRILVDFLTQRFPNTQFIVTAHSPLLVQSAADANLVLLRREGNHIIIDNDPVSVKNWRVDQILTSDLFGLESARPKETEKLLTERAAILSKPRMTAKDSRRLSELDERIGPLPYGETPEEMKADFLIKEIARKINGAEHSRQKGHHDQDR